MITRSPGAAASHIDLTAFGYIVRDDALARALDGQGLEIDVVGDALAPRTIHDAILTATRAARRI